MFFMPETPRWLMSKGRSDDSFSVLSKIEPQDTLQTTFSQMEEEIKKDQKNSSKWKDLFKPWLKTPLIIAIGIMFFQQFVGISGIIVSLLALSTCFIFANQMAEYGKLLTILLVFFYVAFYAISIGPLGWLIISEIFPQHVRGLGASLGSLSVWFFNSIVTFTFFKIVKVFSIPGTELMVSDKKIGNPAGAFFFYGVIALAGLVWGYYFIPETKGMTLEKIEKHWKEGGKLRDLK